MSKEGYWKWLFRRIKEMKKGLRIRIYWKSVKRTFGEFFDLEKEIFFDLYNGLKDILSIFTYAITHAVFGALICYISFTWLLLSLGDYSWLSIIILGLVAVISGLISTHGYYREHHRGN
jgi:hypothetical protein